MERKQTTPGQENVTKFEGRHPGARDAVSHFDKEEAGIHDTVRLVGWRDWRRHLVCE